MKFLNIINKSKKHREDKLFTKLKEILNLAEDISYSCCDLQNVDNVIEFNYEKVSFSPYVNMNLTFLDIQDNKYIINIQANATSSLLRLVTRVQSSKSNTINTYEGNKVLFIINYIDEETLEVDPIINEQNGISVERINNTVKLIENVLKELNNKAIDLANEHQKGLDILRYE